MLIFRGVNIKTPFVLPMFQCYPKFFHIRPWKVKLPKYPIGSRIGSFLSHLHWGAKRGGGGGSGIDTPLIISQLPRPTGQPTPFGIQLKTLGTLNMVEFSPRHIAIRRLTGEGRFSSCLVKNRVMSPIQKRLGTARLGVAGIGGIGNEILPRYPWDPWANEKRKALVFCGDTPIPQRVYGSVLQEKKDWQAKWTTYRLPATNIASEKWRLANNPFLLSFVKFSGAFAVSFRETIRTVTWFLWKSNMLFPLWLSELVSCQQLTYSISWKIIINPEAQLNQSYPPFKGHFDFG